MAGHSHFANVRHKKDIQDAKKAKLFTKLQREITIAIKTGQPNPEFNPRLRNAIIAARSSNMPKDRIEAAIKKATLTNEGDNFEEVRYEGYGPAGVAIIVEALTDNRNRTAGEVRSIFTKMGAGLGETGSVAFMFDRVGLIEYAVRDIAEETIFEVALEVGAKDVISDPELHQVICQPDDFTEVRDGLIKKFGDPNLSKLDWLPKTTTTLDLEQTQKLMKLIEALEDNDDVQSVTGNYLVPDEVADKL